MRAIIQRVERAAVRVEGDAVGVIARGLLVFVGVEKQDGLRDVEALADKLARLRGFEDGEGRMNLDAASAGGEFLIVSQFTLAASLARGRRPSFDGAASPEQAEPLIAAVVNHLASRGFRVQTGRFRAHMKVELVNDGPVTFVLDVRGGKVSRAG